MPRIVYQETRFKEATLATIERANEILVDYAAQGYDLTLRQLYYQFVSRDWLANSDRNYKRLGSIISKGRDAGMIDWSHLVDRTRAIKGTTHWDNPAEIVSSCAYNFRIDKWANQPRRIEIWIEKEALAGVFERVCEELDLDFFSCKGYTSSSSVWRAGRRLAGYIRDGQEPIVFHFGDHDPSGIDMTRDIRERLKTYAESPVCVRRLALNMDQIEEHAPPPNPAKTTDSRAKDYIQAYGNESWELDALTPSVLSDLVREEVALFRDQDLWEEATAEEEEHRRLLEAVSDNWSSVVKTFGGDS